MRLQKLAIRASLAAIFMMVVLDMTFGQSLSHEQIETIKQSFSTSQTQYAAGQLQIFRANQEKVMCRNIWREKAWWAAIAGSAADVMVSATRIDGTRIREANPLFRKNGGEFDLGRSLAFTTGLLTTEYLIWRKHPKQARRFMWLTAGLRGGVALYGLSINR